MHLTRKPVLLIELLHIGEEPLEVQEGLTIMEACNAVGITFHPCAT